MRKKHTKSFGAFALAALLSGSAVAAGCANPRMDVSILKSEGTIFEGPLSAQEVEAQHIIQINKNGQQKPVAFGYSNQHWLAVKAHLAESAELFLLRSPEEVQLQRPTGEIVSYGAVKAGCIKEVIMAIRKVQ